MSEKSKVRATTHRGRKGKNGVYSPRHNDRNFDTKDVKHIDDSKAMDNRYWHWQNQVSMTFEEAERRFYNKFFSAALEESNQKYIKNRHPENQKTIDEYRTSARYAPEEELIQLGKRGQNRPSSNTLIKILQEYTAWEKSLWEGQKDKVRIQPLDVALHRDEPGAADHIHRRVVYMVKNQSGNWTVNQEEALRLLGFERPHPEQKRGRHNNRKMAFTAASREKFMEIAKAHGVDIEEVPKEPGESGLELLEYKATQEKAALEELKAAQSRIQADIERLKSSPVYQAMDAIERDKLLKRAYPVIWEQLDRFVQNSKKATEWKPENEEKMDTFIKEKDNLER